MSSVFKVQYEVAYNANGGTGDPAAQSKTHGTALTLSSTKPTRSGYEFTEWNTKADGSGTSYAAGASYTANASIYAEGVTSMKVKTTDGTNTVYSRTYYVRLDRTLPKVTRSNCWGNLGGDTDWWKWYVHIDYSDNLSGINYRYIEWDTGTTSNQSNTVNLNRTDDNIGTSSNEINLYIIGRDAAGNQTVYGWEKRTP